VRGGGWQAGYRALAATGAGRDALSNGTTINNGKSAVKRAGMLTISETTWDPSQTVAAEGRAGAWSVLPAKPWQGAGAGIFAAAKHAFAANAAWHSNSTAAAISAIARGGLDSDMFTSYSIPPGSTRSRIAGDLQVHHHVAVRVLQVVAVDHVHLLADVGMR
jgi:hypothetical protein